jgi:hypothetical protein
MTIKYQPLATPADLSVATLEAALATVPKFHLHVSTELDDIARRIVAEPEVADEHIEIIVEEDLGPHEWYITAAVGSNPA